MVTRRKGSLIEGPIFPGLFRLFLPIMLGALLQQCYNTIDIAIVGRFLGKEALAAVGGTSSTLTNLVMEFLVGIFSGAAVVIAQYFGAGKQTELERSVRVAVILGSVLGILLSIAGIVGAPVLLHHMNAPEPVAAMAQVYLQTFFCGLLGMALYNTGAAILRAMGDTRRPLYVLVFCCVMNLLLDILFVVILKTGIQGAALATVIAQIGSAILVLYLLKKRMQVEKQKHWNVYQIRTTMGRMIAIGFPSGLQAVMYAVTNMIIQSRVNTFSTDVIAAVSVFDRLEGFFWMFFSAFGVAVLTFMGQNFGAGNLERIKKGVRVALAAGIMMAILLSAGSMLAGNAFYGLFTEDITVQEQGLSILYYLMPWYFIYVFIEVFSATIRSTGKVLIPLLICCLGICVIRIIWGLVIAPQFHDVKRLLLCYPISWTATAVLFLLYYRYGNVIKQGEKKR